MSKTELQVLPPKFHLPADLPISLMQLYSSCPGQKIGFIHDYSLYLLFEFTVPSTIMCLPQIDIWFTPSSPWDLYSKATLTSETSLDDLIYNWKPPQHSTPFLASFFFHSTFHYQPYDIFDLILLSTLSLLLFCTFLKAKLSCFSSLSL